MDFPFNTIDLLRAFALSAFAGLSTGIGGLFVLRKEAVEQKYLSFSLGLSAGVMIYISFMEMLVNSFNSLSKLYGEKTGGWYSLLAFFGGIAFIALIDHFIPEEDNPHEMHGLEQMGEEGALTLEPGSSMPLDKASMLRTGLLSTLAIGIHNFPEGIASFMSALADPALGVSIAIAIAIHNIPEGISLAIPIKYATGSSKKAIVAAFLSGLAEPLGALIGFFLLRPYLSESLLAITFGVVAGIMIYISLDELLPAAQRMKEHHHHAMGGVVLGLFLMALTLQLL